MTRTDLRATAPSGNDYGLVFRGDPRDTPVMEPRRTPRGWVIDILAGGLIGGVVGAIAAVNIVIFSGIDSGYESSLADVFSYNALVGLVAVFVLVGAPIAGVVIARRIRRTRIHS